jgi:hypothetical protein
VEIAAALEQVAHAPALREGSLALWRRRYAANENFHAFIRALQDDLASVDAEGQP